MAIKEFSMRYELIEKSKLEAWEKSQIAETPKLRKKYADQYVSLADLLDTMKSEIINYCKPRKQVKSE
jgi:hypothetical protein